MPDEAATLEAETPVEAIADPAPDAPPTPEVETQPEGDAPPPAEGDAPDYSAVIEELEAEAERRAEAKVAEKLAAEQKRGEVRKQEADSGHQARQAQWEQSERAARASAAELRRLAETGELDPDGLNKHFDTLIPGIFSMAEKRHETAVQAHIDASLPDMTEAEAQELEPLLYEYRRNGVYDGLPQKVTELAMARKDAEIADLKKQLANRAGLSEAAKKLAAAREAVGPGVGSETPKGAPVAQSFEQLESIYASGDATPAQEAAYRAARRERGM